VVTKVFCGLGDTSPIKVVKTKIGSVFFAVAFLATVVAFSGCMESKTESYDDEAWLGLYSRSNEDLNDSFFVVFDTLLNKPETDANLIKIRDGMGDVEQLANDALTQSKEYKVSKELNTAKNDYEEALTKYANFGSVGRKGMNELLDGKTGTGTETLQTALLDFGEGTEAMDRSKSKIANFTGTES
jgi:hypothetical protein